MDIHLQCAFCKHLKKDLKCNAFPNGIPEKIINGGHDHKNPFPNDNGIRFEIRKDQTK